jgi:hypothetical protein
MKRLEKTMQRLFQTICKRHKNDPDRQHPAGCTLTDRSPPAAHIPGDADLAFPNKRDVDEEVNKFHLKTIYCKCTTNSFAKRRKM